MKGTRGTYPGIERYPVSAEDDPNTLQVPPEREYDSVRRQFPPKHHLDGSATTNVEDAVWGVGETRRTKIRSK